MAEVAGYTWSMRAKRIGLAAVVLLGLFLVWRLVSDHAPERAEAPKVSGTVEGEVVPQDQERRESLTMRARWPKAEFADDEGSDPPPGASSERGEGTDDDAPPDEDEADDATGDAIDVGLYAGRLETLRGRVDFLGAAPPPETIDMSSNPKCHAIGKDHTVRPLVRRATDAEPFAVADAVVWIEGAYEHVPRDDAGVPVIIEHCRYPEVITARVGQALEWTNADATLHNIHVYMVSEQGKRIEHNQAMPRQGMKLKKVASKEAARGWVRSDVHPWMRSEIFVFDHPYFAVTDDYGNFEIRGLPGRGPYKVVVEHAYLGRLEQTLVVDRPVRLKYPRERALAEATD